MSCNDLGESYVWALCPSNRSAEQKMPSFSATAGLGGPGPTPSFGARIGVPDEHSRGGAASLASFLLPEKVEGVQSGEPGCQAPFLRFPCPPARLVQGVHLLPVLLQCHRHKGRSECGELGGHRPQGRGGSTRRAPPQGSPGAQTLAARARQRCPGSWPAWRVARGLRHVRRTPHTALV